MADGPSSPSSDPRIRSPEPTAEGRDWATLLAPIGLVLAGALFVYTVSVAFDIAAVLFSGSSLLAVLDLNALLLMTLYLAAATFVLALRDWSRARTRHAERLAHHRRMKDLEGDDLRRRSFMHEVTHELNTPLTPIDLHLDLLAHGKHGALTREQEQAVQSVKRSMTRLSRLIADMLDMTRIENGRLRLTRRTVHPCSLVAATARSYAPLAEHAHVRLVVDAVPDDSEHTAELDEQRIGQVLDNLVANALKFTPRGGLVHIGCACDGDEVVITVADTGTGIDRASVFKIFEPFEQVQDGVVPQNPGVGLGLYIVQGIVKAHGGTISCTSGGTGRGATFTLRLPCLPPRAQTQAEHAAPETDRDRRVTTDTPLPQPGR